MARNISKEFLIQKYKELKDKFGRIPKRTEFLSHAEIKGNHLDVLYGSRSYSKLQTECGDQANKFFMTRTPDEVIMSQYGDLALELGKLPVNADWVQKGLRPTARNLAQRPHFIKWSEMPYRFRDWVEAERINDYADVIGWIPNSSKLASVEKADTEFERLINDIRQWSPARRRNSEESYKVELRMHLKSIGYAINEEYGESNVDLIVSRKFAIETKKTPSLAEYDRLFGQIARHLQHGECVIAVIMDVPREDQYQNFMLLIDEYLDRDDKSVEVMKK